MRLTSPQRSRNGLPTEGGMGGGRASTHTTPVEQYATDFAQALGGYARLNHQDVSSMTPSKRRRLAKMQEMRLLPQRTLRRGLP